MLPYGISRQNCCNCSVVDLLGIVTPGVPVYGSGGFTTYTNDQLAGQLSGWSRDGIRAVKMKIGADPDADMERVRVAREAIGPGVALFVDANGAYSTKQALSFARGVRRVWRDMV